MKLKECIEVAKECGISTLGEAFDNINFHQTNFFVYEEMQDEVNELDRAIQRLFEEETGKNFIATSASETNKWMDNYQI